MTRWPELVVPITGLRHAGSMRDVVRRSNSKSSITIDETVVARGLETTTSRIPEGSQVRVRATIGSAISGIEVRGSIEASWEGECRRCLDLVEQPLDIELRLTFLPEREADGDADAYPYDLETVDLATVVREELMLSLPLSPLCGDDCVGENPDRFEAAPTDEIDESQPADPRWAALSELSFDEE